MIQIICPLTCQSPLSVVTCLLPVACIFILAHSSVGSVFTQAFNALGLFLMQVKELLLQIIVPRTGHETCQLAEVAVQIRSPYSISLSALL